VVEVWEDDAAVADARQSARVRIVLGVFGGFRIVRYRFSARTWSMS
jgi:hypothetical protein